MSETGSPEEQTPCAVAGASGFRVCLTISELGCASEGAPLERTLRKLDGVRGAAVNPMRDTVSIEVDALPWLEEVIRILERRGYSVHMAEARVTTWLVGSSGRLEALRRELLDLPHVTHCRIAIPTGRVELGVSLRGEWQHSLRDVCTRLCAAADAASEREH